MPITEDFRYEDAIAVPGARRDSSLTVSGVRIRVAPDISIIAPGTGATHRWREAAFRCDVSPQSRRSALRRILFSFIEAAALARLADELGVR